MSNYEVNQRLYLYNLERKKYLFLQTLESLSKFIFPIFAYLYFKTMTSIIYGIAFGYFLSLISVSVSSEYFKFEFSIDWLFLTLLVSSVSQLGDIIISYFKRLSKIKDTGKIIPGHGGLLDRVDGMIFAFPFAWIILTIGIF